MTRQQSSPHRGAQKFGWTARSQSEAGRGTHACNHRPEPPMDQNPSVVSTHSQLTPSHHFNFLHFHVVLFSSRLVFAVICTFWSSAAPHGVLLVANLRVHYSAHISSPFATMCILKSHFTLSNANTSPLVYR